MFVFKNIKSRMDMKLNGLGRTLKERLNRLTLTLIENDTLERVEYKE